MLYYPVRVVKNMCCCFTGHRPEHLPWKTNELDERCIELKNLLSSAIDKYIEDGCREFYCGMARGTDTYAAEILIEKKKIHKDIMLYAALPCPDQHEGWCEKDRLRYENILRQCDSKTLVSPFYTDTCMLARNRFMVDNSDRVIAVWNGYFRGGTAYTVRYAKKQGKEIYLIRPKDLTFDIM